MKSFLPILFHSHSVESDDDDTNYTADYGEDDDWNDYTDENDDDENSASYVCEDCDHRWDDKTDDYEDDMEEDEYDREEAIHVLCPMCGSTHTIEL